MSREFVDAMTVEDNIEAEKVFKNTMANKVGSSLEIKRKEIASTFVNNMTTGTSSEKINDSEV
jgi:hypothetical protein|tara:strand:- start:12 stop:200 length:189 start_codon:yes stop_codon:yes gene_type:complete